MLLYRVKQFWWSLSCSISEKDEEYVKLHLNNDEMNLFVKLKTSEQKHCINVAKDVEQICFNKNIKCDRIIKAALLHDIGKSYKKLSVIDKAVIVILDGLSKGELKKLQKLKKINVYYNHGKIGADMLRNYGYEDKLLYLIENHHNKNICDDIELNILRSCDNRH